MKRLANPLKTIDDSVYLNHFDVAYSTLFFNIDLVWSGTGWDIEESGRVIQIIEQGVRTKWWKQ